jgi:hypothetical protein
MVSANSIHSNGSNGHFLHCPSNHELVDVTPMATPPRPKWRDQFPQFTHNLSWLDADGCSHSMTLRSDDLQGLMSDLKLLKGMIKAAKQKAAESASQSTQTTQTPEPDSDVPPCKIHGVPMERRTSKRTSGVYFFHRLPGSKELCFGREAKA